jgi:hypothetical protein
MSGNASCDLQTRSIIISLDRTLPFFFLRPCTFQLIEIFQVALRMKTRYKVKKRVMTCNKYSLEKVQLWTQKVQHAINSATCAMSQMS